MSTATTTRTRVPSDADRILLIERTPQPEWFVSALNEKGEKEWYVRLHCTGLFPRRYGPFKTQQQGLFYLDAILDHALEAFGGPESPHRPAREPVVEDALASRYLTAGA